jgi:hypothetical protein
MRCKLQSVGNELSLNISPEMLEQLGISAADELEITTDGDRLVIFRAGDDAFKAAAKFAFERYGSTLQALAD